MGKTVGIDLSMWNAIGRSVALHDAIELRDFHEGCKEEPLLQTDPRSPELAEAVLAEIIRLNNQGRANEARALFDPAQAPFIAEFAEAGRGLGFCAILGPDEFLVSQGACYAEKTTWHIRGERINQVETLAGFAWSRNRRHFLAVRNDGTITLHANYGAAPLDVIRAIPGSAFVPADLPRDSRIGYEVPGDDPAYSHLAISDDGEKIVLCDAERGIVVLRKERSGWRVELLYPSTEFGFDYQIAEQSEEDDEYAPHLDMIHAAMSPDGRYVALGMQADGHFLIDLDRPKGARLYAKLGHLSEYPHDACFSDDSSEVALNSCHFYNGRTFAVRVADVCGLTTTPYEVHIQQVILNEYLRVYASGYLPPHMTGQASGAFLLAGSGFAACVAENGKLLWELDIGSSGGGVDVCPQTGRVLISSDSGMMHLLDPMRPQDPPIFSGYNTPLELRRWLFWDRLAHPLVW